MLCPGSSFYKKGFICNSEQRDIDLLIESFMETGFTAESMLASRPPQIIKIIVTQPAPPPPPPPTTTTTYAPITTPPPMRRRVAQGWVNSGALPCEDINPTDALDADCYSSRYSTLKGAMFDQLGTVSVGVDTTRVFQLKLGPVINQIVVPQLSTSTANAVTNAASDLKLASDSALAQANDHVTGAQNTTNSLDAAIGLVATNVNNLFKSRMQGAFDNLTTTEIANINALIRRANYINTNNTIVRGSNILKTLVARITPQIAAHTDTVIRQKVNALALARDNITNAIFYKASNLTALTLPGIVTNNSAWNAARKAIMQNASSAAIGQLISLSQIDAANVEITGKIAARLALEESNFASKLDTKKTGVGAVLQNLQALASNLTASVTDMSSGAVGDIGREAAGVASSTGAVYSQMDQQASLLLSFLNGQGINGIEAWDVAAQRNLANLETMLTDASNALRSTAFSAQSNGTSSLMGTVLQSLATVGSLQKSINDELLQRQTGNMDAMRQLVAKLESSGLDFGKLINTISVLKSSLQNAADLTGTDNMFAYLPAAMDKASQRISGVAADATASFAAAEANASNSLIAYNQFVDAYWAEKLSTGFGAQLRKAVDGNVSLAESDISATEAKAAAMQGESDDATASAIDMLDKTNDLLTSTTSGTDDAAVRMLMSLAASSDFVVNNLTNANALFSSQLGAIGGSAQGDVDTRIAMNGFLFSVAADAVRTDFDKEVNDVRMRVERSVDEFSRTSRAQAANPAEAAYLAASEFNRTTAGGADALRALKLDAFSSLNESISSYENNLEISELIELQRRIITSLAQLAAADPNLNDRISKAMAVSAGMNTTLRTLSQTLVSVNATMQGSSDPLAYIVAIMVEASRIQSVLDAEIGVLSGAIADAATVINAPLAELGAELTPYNVAGLGDSWGQSIIDTYKSSVDGMYAGGAAWIVAQRAAIPAIDGLLKSEISKDMTITASLNADFDTTLKSQASASDSVMASVGATVAALKANMDASRASDVTALQGMLSNVALAVDNSLGASSGQLAGLLAGTVGDVSDRSAASDTALTGLSAQADSALAGAAGAITASSQAAEMMDGIIAAGERERSNSAAAVLNTLQRDAANMQAMLAGAIESAVGELASGDSLETNSTGFVATLSQQLGGWTVMADAHSGQLEEFRKNSLPGIEGETLAVRATLDGIGNTVLGKARSVRATLSSVSAKQAELKDRFVELVRAAHGSDSALDALSAPVTGIDAADVLAGTVNPASENAMEQTAMAELESRVDTMLSFAQR